jgi:small conductance mechanosensitive channel
MLNELSGYAANAKDLVMQYGLNLFWAVITLVLGLWLIKFLGKAFARALEKSKIDVSLEKFLLSLVRIILQVLLVITVISMLGVEMTSFIAILGAAGLAVGLALQGSLANFAGGVLILFFKPFKVDDFIEAQGYLGKVSAIQVFNTILKTPDNKTIVIPNGVLSNGSITNFTTESQRRIEWTFGIGYDDDLRKAKEILHELIKADTRILPEPAPMVAVSELGDSSVNFVARVWVNAADYWNVYYAMQESVKLSFDEKGISIPFPQRDVHVYNH